MRKMFVLVVLLVAALAVGLQSASAVVTSCDPGIYVVSVNSAKVRAASNTTSQQLALVRRNVNVTVTGGEEGAVVSGSNLWCVVDMATDAVGYIHSSLLNVAATGATANPITVASAAVAPVATVTSPNTDTSSNTAVNTAPSEPVLISTPVPQIPMAGASCPNLSYTCSQLTCSQARACLAAGNGRLDGDNDGTPCESVCGRG